MNQHLVFNENTKSFDLNNIFFIPCKQSKLSFKGQIEIKKLLLSLNQTQKWFTP